MMKQIGRFNVTTYSKGVMHRGRWLALIIIDEFDNKDKPIGHRSYYGWGESFQPFENEAAIGKALSDESQVAKLYALPEHKIVNFVDVGVVMVA